MILYSLIIGLTFTISPILGMTTEDGDSLVAPFDSNHALITAYGVKLSSEDYQIGKPTNEAMKNIYASLLQRASILRQEEDAWTQASETSIPGDSDLECLKNSYESTRSYLVSHWNTNSVALKGEYFYMKPELLHAHLEQLNEHVGRLNQNKPDSVRLGVMYLFAAAKQLTVVHYDQSTKQYVPGLPVETQKLPYLNLNNYFEELARNRDFRPGYVQLAERCKLAAVNLAWGINKNLNPRYHSK